MLEDRWYPYKFGGRWRPLMHTKRAAVSKFRCPHCYSGVEPGEQIVFIVWEDGQPGGWAHADECPDPIHTGGWGVTEGAGGYPRLPAGHAEARAATGIGHTAADSSVRPTAGAGIVARGRDQGEAHHDSRSRPAHREAA